MYAAADEERYEQAAQLRDTIRTLETLRDRQQKMATPRMGDRDAIGAKLGPGGAVVQVFQVRSGRVVDRVEMVTNADQARDARIEDLLERAVTHAYADSTPPPEVLLPMALPDMDLLAEWLSARAGRQVVLGVPQRGDKRALLDLAERNASLSYDSRFNEDGAANYEALETLQAALALPALPRRVDCFDISTLQGAETVASMVVCQDGRMKRSEYRKFRIRREGAEPTRFLDDFAAMQQVVTRRYRKVADQDGPWPDLIVIDGGKGQLNAAYAALEGLGLDHLVAVGLAKQEELVFTRDRVEPIAFGMGTPALRLLQRIRDEAHRFAVTFHRTARGNRDLRSELDDIAQVGPRRRRQLLTTFGSLAGVRRASREELTAVVGAKVADAVADGGEVGRRIPVAAVLVHDDEGQRIALAVGEAGDEHDARALVVDEQTLGVELGDDIGEHVLVERLAALLEVVDAEQVVDGLVGPTRHVEELPPGGARRRLLRLEVDHALARAFVEVGVVLRAGVRLPVEDLDVGHAEVGVGGALVLEVHEEHPELGAVVTDVVDAIEGVTEVLVDLRQGVADDRGAQVTDGEFLGDVR
jgi:hypothetical protein